MKHSESDMEKRSLASFEALKEAREAEYPSYREKEEAVINALKGLVPRAGLKCTMVYWSDYRASTVVRIISEKEIAVRHNATHCIDWYGGLYDIYDRLEGEEYIFTRRRNGTWIEKGQPTRDGVLLALNYHRHYIDPSF